MPQALRVIIPPLGNSVNGLLKTTSIASVISMEEVLRRGQILMQQKFQVLEVFMVVAILYLAMTTCWDFVQRRIEAHYGRAYGAAADPSWRATTIERTAGLPGPLNRHREPRSDEA